MRSFYLVAIFKVVEEEVGVGDGEDEVLHLLTQHMQVLAVLHISKKRKKLSFNLYILSLYVQVLTILFISKTIKIFLNFIYLYIYII